MHKEIASKPAQKKPEWKIDKDIKQELEDSATQNIEEFESQDLNFDDDFSNDAPMAVVPEVLKADIKMEDLPSTAATIRCCR